MMPNNRQASLCLAFLIGLMIAAIPLRYASAGENHPDNQTAPEQGTSRKSTVTSGTSASSMVQPQGTLRMIELLQKTRQELEQHPERAAFESDLDAARERELLRQATNDEQRLFAQPRLAMSMLRSGYSEEALKQFDLYESMLTNSGNKPNAQTQSFLDIMRAMCYLRLGEQENCISNHNADSCLMPIRGDGVHKLQRGSRAAIGLLSQHLKHFPTDLRARWLLNLACMTVGDYPDKVPENWLIPPKVFQSDYDIKRFPDVAEAVGLDVDGLAGGLIVEDFDGDGYLDVMTSDWSLKGQLRYFHNNADGTFTERTKEAGLTGIVGGLNMVQTDFNNDGFPDVLILRGGWLGVAGHQPRSLLKNNGDGTFEDVTDKAHLQSLHPTQTAAWFDFNGDGWLDLFVGCESTPNDPNPCELYRNNGDGTFTECSKESGITVTQFIKGTTAGDYNNDGRPDLYLSNLSGQNFLFRNDGPADPGGGPKSKWKFTEVAKQAGVTEPMHSFPCWFWDYNNDGYLDIFVCGFGIRDVGDVAADYLGLPSPGVRPRLYRNNGDGTFTDVTAQSHLNKVLVSMGSNFGDLDNDGWLDFYLGGGNFDITTLMPNRMFRNAEGKYFQDVTTSGDFGNIRKGHGVAFADFNNDGNQDVFIKMGGAFVGDHFHTSLFLNPGNSNHWVTLKLEGVISNRIAVGARIRVIVDTDHGERSIYKTVGTGGSFGASPLRQEIGLGQAKSIRAVEIFWPVTGKTQTVTDLQMDHFYRIREGNPEPQLWNLKSFAVATQSTHHHHHDMQMP